MRCPVISLLVLHLTVPHLCSDHPIRPLDLSADKSSENKNFINILIESVMSAMSRNTTTTTSSPDTLDNDPGLDLIEPREVTPGVKGVNSSSALSSKFNWRPVLAIDLTPRPVASDGTQTANRWPVSQPPEPLTYPYTYPDLFTMGGGQMPDQSEEDYAGYDQGYGWAIGQTPKKNNYPPLFKFTMTLPTVKFATTPSPTYRPNPNRRTLSPSTYQPPMTRPVPTTAPTTATSTTTTTTSSTTTPVPNIFYKETLNPFHNNRPFVYQGSGFPIMVSISKLPVIKVPTVPLDKDYSEGATNWSWINIQIDIPVDKPNPAIMTTGGYTKDELITLGTMFPGRPTTEHPLAFITANRSTTPRMLTSSAMNPAKKEKRSVSTKDKSEEFVPVVPELPDVNTIINEDTMDEQYQEHQALDNKMATYKVSTLAKNKRTTTAGAGEDLDEPIGVTSPKTYRTKRTSAVYAEDYEEDLDWNDWPQTSSTVKSAVTKHPVNAKIYDYEDEYGFYDYIERPIKLNREIARPDSQSRTSSAIPFRPEWKTTPKSRHTTHGSTKRHFVFPSSSSSPSPSLLLTLPPLPPLLTFKKPDMVTREPKAKESSSLPTTTTNGGSQTKPLPRLPNWLLLLFESLIPKTTTLLPSTPVQTTTNLYREPTVEQDLERDELEDELFADFKMPLVTTRYSRPRTHTRTTEMGDQNIPVSVRDIAPAPARRSSPRSDATTSGVETDDSAEMAYNGWPKARPHRTSTSSPVQNSYSSVSQHSANSGNQVGANSGQSVNGLGVANGQPGIVIGNNSGAGRRPAKRQPRS